MDSDGLWGMEKSGLMECGGKQTRKMKLKLNMGGFEWPMRLPDETRNWLLRRNEGQLKYNLQTSGNCLWQDIIREQDYITGKSFMCCIYVYMSIYMDGNTWSYDCVILFVFLEAVMFILFTHTQRNTQKHTHTETQYAKNFAEHKVLRSV